jgi:hypothetical protein
MTSQASYRYRMHVQGVYSGSSVYEILAEKVNGPLLPEEKPGDRSLKVRLSLSRHRQALCSS